MKAFAEAWRKNSPRFLPQHKIAQREYQASADPLYHQQGTNSSPDDTASADADGLRVDELKDLLEWSVA